MYYDLDLSLINLTYLLKFVNQRPNFKNLSRGLNLRRTQIWLGPLKIVFNVPNSMFKPALT